MKKLTQIKTRNEILDLQKNDTLTITLTKEQARLIGFAIGTEIDTNDKCVKELARDLESADLTKEQKDIIKDTISFTADNSSKLEDMRDNLKKFYGVLIN